MARDCPADQCIDVVPAGDVGLLEVRRTAAARDQIESRLAALERLRHHIGNDDGGSLRGKAGGYRAANT